MTIKFDTKEERQEYYRGHQKVRKIYGDAKEHDCDCGRYAQVWAHLHNTDFDDPDNYVPMCYWCHNSYDAFTMYNKERNAKVSEASRKMWEEASPEKRKAMSGNAYGERSSEAKANIKAGSIKRYQNDNGKERAYGKRTPEQCERIRIARWGR